MNSRETSGEDLSKFDSEITEKDPYDIHSFIYTIYTYVSQLENNSYVPQRKKILTTILVLLGWLIYGGIETWFFFHTDYKIHKTVIFGTFGAIAAFVNSFVTPLFCWKPIPISAEEYNESIFQMQEDLIIKLNEMKSEMSKDLQHNISEFERKYNAIKQSYDRTKVIDGLQKISKILDKIQAQLAAENYKNGLNIFSPSINTMNGHSLDGTDTNEDYDDYNEGSYLTNGKKFAFYNNGTV